MENGAIVQYKKEKMVMENSNQTIAEKVKQQFEKLFGGEFLLVKSPGRINIIGEHTDYNEGYVLPAAIDKAVYFAISLRDDNEIHLAACDLDETFSIEADNLKPVGDLSWPNYILGTVAAFQKRGIKVPGFNAVFASNVPIGAGLSSSAAVECATVFSLNEILHTNFNKIELAKMAMEAEHEFAGVMCGIMDQFASTMGQSGHAVKLDCRSLQYEYVPIDLTGIKIVLFNTRIKHSLASSEYNTRRKECEQAVAWIKEYEPHVHSLRDVTEAMLNKYVLPKDKLIDMRGRFVVQEINRVLKACEDLKKGDINALGKKMFATHDGLSKMYGVSCMELDYLVNLVRGNDAVIGSRMMGGGFGGCTINLVKEDAIEYLSEKISDQYFIHTGKKLETYVVSIGNGTEKIAQ